MSRKTTLLLLSLAASLGSLKGQNYTFEDNYDGWSSTSGTLTISDQRYKEGENSLRWQVQGEAQLEVSGFEIKTSAQTCANMYIHSAERSNDIMVVEFLRGDKVEKSGTFIFNYKGWHEFKRCYKDYENSANVTIDKLRFTLKPTSNKSRTIYFDGVDLKQRTTPKKDIVGPHWVLDFEQLKWANSGWGQYVVTKGDPYRFYSSPRDIAIEKPTKEELKALKKIRSQFKPNAKFFDKAYNRAVEYLDKLEIEYNADGSIKSGKSFASNSADITIKTYTDSKGAFTHLAALAGGVNGGQVDAIENFNALFDYVIDQGLGEGAPVIARSNSYNDIRFTLGNWIAIIAGCRDDERYNEALAALRWFSYYGAMYTPQDCIDFGVSSDVMYLTSKEILTAIACDKDDLTAVRDLKAYKRYLERALRFTPGVNDMLKPDGTGFHHGVHYINYMRAYTTITSACYWVSDTPFKVSQEAYENLRRAVITIFTTATTSSNEMNMYALSLCGRSPFSNNHKASYRQRTFEELISVGRDCLGVDSEPIAEAAYNYFYNSSKYNVEPSPYEGFYGFNYAPVGVYRNDNWVITMRSPTSAFFGAEIYAKTNRFGRYQANGTLEVMYSGNDLSASGYPTTMGSGGWDWNSPAGGTTVRFADWESMMPNGDVSKRHDQHANSDFSGALSFGKVGMYGCEYVQRESWTEKGSSNYKGLETNLSYKKSFYCFDDMVIALGSNIKTSGDYPEAMTTETTLFQEIVTNPNKTSLRINGKDHNKGYNSVLSSAKSDNWFVTSTNTGYFVPKGNDNLVVMYDDQTTPNHSGADCLDPKTTLTAIKSYFIHGHKTTNSQYCYIVKPNASPEQMQKIEKEVTSGSLYTIERQDSVMHSINYLPQSTRAYSFFAATDNLDFGIVKSVSAPHLLMVREEAQNGSYHFAICDPNLHPEADERERNHECLFTPSTVTIVLDREYTPLEEVEGVIFSKSANGTTSIKVELQDGFARYFSMKK